MTKSYLCKICGNTSELWDRIENQNTTQVEKQMTERNLESRSEAVRFGGHCSKDSSRRGSDIGAKGERIYAFHGNQTQTNKRCEGWCEYGWWLDQNGHSHSHQHGNVSGQKSKRFREVWVEGFSDDLWVKNVVGMKHYTCFKPTLKSYQFNLEFRGQKIGSVGPNNNNDNPDFRK